MVDGCGPSIRYGGKELDYSEKTDQLAEFGISALSRSQSKTHDVGKQNASWN